MDHSWAAGQLKVFLKYMDDLQLIEVAEGEAVDEEDERMRQAALRDTLSPYGSKSHLVDKLISLDPIMRDLMSAAEPDLATTRPP
jgi:hypothetical protein